MGACLEGWQAKQLQVYPQEHNSFGLDMTCTMCKVVQVKDYKRADFLQWLSDLAQIRFSAVEAVQ